MKQVQVSVVLTRWIEVEDDADAHSVLYQTEGVFAGIDGSVWNIDAANIIDEEIG